MLPRCNEAPRPWEDSPPSPRSGARPTLYHPLYPPATARCCRRVEPGCSHRDFAHFAALQELMPVEIDVDGAVSDGEMRMSLGGWDTHGLVRAVRDGRFTEDDFEAYWIRVCCAAPLHTPCTRPSPSCRSRISSHSWRGNAWSYRT